MQYTIKIYGTHNTYNLSGVKARRADDSDYSYKMYATKKMNTEAKGLYKSIKLELYLDGVLVDTTYGKI
jgi:hypothetical protein